MSFSDLIETTDGQSINTIMIMMASGRTIVIDANEARQIWDEAQMVINKIRSVQMSGQHG